MGLGLIRFWGRLGLVSFGFGGRMGLRSFGFGNSFLEVVWGSDFLLCDFSIFCSFGLGPRASTLRSSWDRSLKACAIRKKGHLVQRVI